MRKTGDFSKQSTKEYQRRWIAAYGHDFNMVTIHPLLPLVRVCLLVPRSTDINSYKAKNVPLALREF